MFEVAQADVIRLLNANPVMKERILQSLEKERRAPVPFPPLSKDELRSNSHAFDEWVRRTGIYTHGTFDPELQRQLDNARASGETYLTMRARQNAAWSQKITLEGISLAQGGDLDKAMRKYNQAIEVYPECVEAFVARGAAQANAGKFDKAVADFERCLEIKPDHQNAAIYLSKCKAKVAAIEAERKSAMENEFLMELETRPDRNVQKSDTVNSLDRTISLNSLPSLSTSYSKDPDRERRKKEKKDRKEKKSKKEKHKKSRRRSRSSDDDEDSEDEKRRRRRRRSRDYSRERSPGRRRDSSGSWHERVVSAERPNNSHSPERHHAYK